MCRSDLSGFRSRMQRSQPLGSTDRQRAVRLPSLFMGIPGADCEPQGLLVGTTDQARFVVALGAAEYWPESGGVYSRYKQLRACTLGSCDY